MMELSQTALFIGSIINLYALVLILRAWLQFARVDYYNPVSTFAVKMTDPVLKRLRKFAPTVKNIDTSALLLIFIIGMLKGIIYFFKMIDKCFPKKPFVGIVVLLFITSNVYLFYYS